jgi:starch synthase
MVTLLPGYPAVLAALGSGEPVSGFADLFGGAAQLLAGRVAGQPLLVLDAPHLFNRPGNPYLGPDGRDWQDNAVRFAALGLAAARVAQGGLEAFVPDIVHGHDWQAGLTMAYLAAGGGRRPATVMTVHNLAFSGRFPSELLQTLQLPPAMYAIEGVEFFGSISFLKAGLQFADRLTTVSPTYAKEIQTPEEGCGFDGLLRARSSVLSGILNGIDTEVWNPATDPLIPSHFTSRTLKGRRPNKAALQARFHLFPDPDRLLFAVVSRLTWQKGIDVLAGALPVLLATGAQLVILGTGEPALEARLAKLAVDHRGQVGCIIGYDEPLAHLVQAGTDALLVPSRFEPCGLTQLCALRYGAVPVVARVGGLADTVADLDVAGGDPDSATGFHVAPLNQAALEGTVCRVATLWANRMRWTQLQTNGMRKDVSWSGPARQYGHLYGELLATKS